MIIIEDTRNQIGKHNELNLELSKLGYRVLRSKLYVGDYTRLDNQTICIDTKKDWLEVAGNVCGRQHKRFRQECIKAKEAGIRLIILVEEETLIEEWNSPLNRLKQPLTKVKCEVLAKAIKTMNKKYGVEFINCNKKDTAKILVDILKGEENGKIDKVK